jgi:hypothetical protein
MDRSIAIIFSFGFCVSFPFTSDRTFLCDRLWVKVSGYFFYNHVPLKWHVLLRSFLRYSFRPVLTSFIINFPYSPSPYSFLHSDTHLRQLYFRGTEIWLIRVGIALAAVLKHEYGSRSRLKNHINHTFKHIRHPTIRILHFHKSWVPVDDV